MMGLAAVATEIFLVLIIAMFYGRWDTALVIGLIAAGSLCNLLILGLDLFFFLRGKEIAYKSCIILYVLLLFVAVIAFVLLQTGFLDIVSDSELLEQYLRDAGPWMIPLFIALQFLQVILLPIPSTVTVAAGTALFGPLLGSFYSLAGILLGSVTAFLVGRHAGYQVVSWLVGEDTLKSCLKRIKGKDKLFLTFMFLLPVFPDDVLCFVAGLTTMSLLFFVVVIVISRVLSIFATSYLIALIPFTTWWGILIWICLAVAIAALFVLLYKKMDAIQNWFARKLHRETRVQAQQGKDEFQVEIVDPDGSIVEKSVRGKEEK